MSRRPDDRCPAGRRGSTEGSSRSSPGGARPASWARASAPCSASSSSSSSPTASRRPSPGTLFAATSAFLILESVALLGTDTGLVRWLPAHLASGRAADLPRTLVVATVPVLALSLAGRRDPVRRRTDPGARTWSGPEAAATMTVMLQALALVLPVAALHDLVLAATRGAGLHAADGRGRQHRPARAPGPGRPGGLSSPAGARSALALAWSLPYVLGSGVAAPGGSVGWCAGATRQRRAVRRWGVLAREFWAYTAPRAIARVTQTALKRSDIVLVAALASPADAALYTAATRFVVLGQLFVQSVQQALSPHLSALFARGETQRRQLDLPGGHPVEHDRRLAALPGDRGVRVRR